MITWSPDKATTIYDLLIFSRGKSLGVLFQLMIELCLVHYVVLNTLLTKY